MHNMILHNFIHKYTIHVVAPFPTLQGISVWAPVSDGITP